MNALRARLRAVLADPNPILVKELRGVFRTKLYIRFLYLSTLAIAAMVLLLGATVVDGNVSPANAGRAIFQVFFSLAVGVLAIVGPAHGAASITGEREAQTYESLLLTGMDPKRIVLGKFMASYASLALVLIALAPIAGVVFLFGGVAPLYVLVAFASALIALAPGVAFGVAISAHVGSSRLGVLAALATWPFIMLFGLIAFTIFGAEMQRTWELSLIGPFWFAEALVERYDSLDTLFALGVLPLYVVVMTVWFCLAAAIAGVRPAAEDRSTPLKWWALGSSVGPLVLVGVAPHLGTPRDSLQAMAVSLGLLFCAFYFYVNVFVNEPPLPPRVVRHPGGALREWLRRVFGPGARSSMRFAAYFMTAFALATLLVWTVSHGLVHGWETARGALEGGAGFALVALGMLTFSLFLLGLGTLVRVRTRSGVASRAILFAVVMALVVLPTMVSLILDSRSIDRLDREIPTALAFSPLAPFSAAVLVADRHYEDALMVFPFAMFYLALAIGLYAAAANRIKAIVASVEASRSALAARPSAAPSAPPPGLTRESVPPPLSNEPPEGSAEGLEADPSRAQPEEEEEVP